LRYHKGIVTDIFPKSIDINIYPTIVCARNVVPNPTYSIPAE
jgi:hypothetical protein